MMETKTLSVALTKADDEGKVSAKFATLGVKDKHGDLIERGAFGDQMVRVSAYNHESWFGALPLPPGKGSIREDGDDAIADLQFFLNTWSGREHFETIKEMGDLQEWSFGFDITEWAAPNEEQEQMGVRRVLKALKVHEVSPVLLGAGIGTRTLTVKSEEPPTDLPKSEEKATTDEAQDASPSPEHEAALRTQALLVGRKAREILDGTPLR